MARLLDVDWSEANCIGEDIDIFFDAYETSSTQASETDTICMSCPIRKLCLIEAVQNYATGVFGGMYLSMGNYSKQRNKHKSKRQANACISEVQSIKEYLEENNV